MRQAGPKILIPVLTALLLTHCAQTAPPVPPSLELPKPVTDLRAVRKGDKVYLRWTVPTQTTDGESVRDLGRTRVCRSLDMAMSQCDTAVGEVPPMPVVKTDQEKAKSSTVKKAEASYSDTLSPDLQQDPARLLTYSVVVLNESGRSAGLSNKVQVPAATTLSAPADFKVQVTAEGMVLSWTVLHPQEGAGLRHFYRVYRRQEGSKADTVAGELRLAPSSVQLVDQGFEWGKTYYYRVTVVTEAAQEGLHNCGSPQEPQADCATVFQVEGDDSEPVKVFADDIFPPAVPSGIQAVFSGAGQKPFIDLIWTPNMESDLAGYNIYRHEEGGQPAKINPDLVKTPASRDSDVQPGKKYFYSVSAVDARGNESGHSEEASEQVP